MTAVNKAISIGCVGCVCVYVCERERGGGGFVCEKYKKAYFDTQNTFVELLLAPLSSSGGSASGLLQLKFAPISSMLPITRCLLR